MNTCGNCRLFTAFPDKRSHGFCRWSWGKTSASESACAQWVEKGENACGNCKHFTVGKRPWGACKVNGIDPDVLDYEGPCSEWEAKDDEFNVCGNCEHSYPVGSFDRVQCAIRDTVGGGISQDAPACKKWKAKTKKVCGNCKHSRALLGIRGNLWVVGKCLAREGLEVGWSDPGCGSWEKYDK